MSIQSSLAKTRAALLQHAFFSRSDFIAARIPYDVPDAAEPRYIPRPVAGGSAMEGLLLAHVAGPGGAPSGIASYTGSSQWGKTYHTAAGHFRVGSYLVSPEGRCVAGCVDYDDHGRDTDLADPLGAALACYARAVAREIPVYLERSGSGRGWHLWVFVAPGEAPNTIGITAGAMRAVLISLLPDGDAGEARILRRNGTTAGPAGGGGLEVFPKQNQHRTDARLGNLVWLPWWSEATAHGDGRNEFYAVRLSPDGAPALGDVYQPEDFDCVSCEKADAIYEEYQRVKKEEAKKTEAERTAHAATRPRAERSSADEAAEVESALSALSPDMDYGEWVRLGMSIHAWDSTTRGLSLWDAWSAHGSKYVEGECEQKWRGFHATGGGVGIGSLFHAAKTAGWKPTRPAPPDGSDWYADLQAWDGADAAPAPTSPTGGAPLSDPTTAPPPAPQGAAPKTPPTGGMRPSIQVNARQFRDILDDSADALRAWSDSESARDGARTLFRRSGELCTLTRILEETGVNTQINYISHPELFGMLARSANWVKVSGTGPQKSEVSVPPPRDLPPVMLSQDGAHGALATLPVLHGIACSPVVTPTGTDGAPRVLSTGGYDAASGLYLDLSRMYGPLPSIPPQPTADERTAAVVTLADALADFPFHGGEGRDASSEYAHAVAAILLPLVRRIIHGPTPMHLIEAPTPGSGKSLLADVISMINTGRKASPISLPKNEEETEKKLTSVLLNGSQIILIDNINSSINSGVLASTLTAYPTCQGRRLGASKMLDLSTAGVTWIATGNNPRASLEMARRCVRIRLNADAERPWEKPESAFRHYPLIPWVEAERPRLLAAALTLVSAWIAVGCPSGRVAHGSCEAWGTVIGGILDVAQIPGFLANRAELYANVDTESSEWEEFATVLHEERGAQTVSVADIMEVCERKGLLSSARGDGNAKSAQIRIGKALTARRDRIFGGLRIEARRDAHAKTTRWGVVPVIAAGETCDRIGGVCPVPTALAMATPTLTPTRGRGDAVSSPADMDADEW